MSVERKLYFETKDGEKFYEAHYNDIRIIIREQDGYMNATKMCSDNGRDFKQFIRYDTWREILTYFQATRVGVKSHPPLIKLSKGYSNKIKGQYIHPKLIHFVAHWCSIEYAFKVAHMMDLVNEELHNRTMSLEQKIAELEQDLENANTGRRVVLGEIVIHKKTPGAYHIYPKQRASRLQIKNAEKVPYYNSVQVFNLFKFYVKHNLINGITINDKGIFKGDITLIKNYLDVVSHRGFRSNLSFSEIIKLAKLEAIRARNITQKAIRGTISESPSSDELTRYLSPQQLGFLFEIYCAEKYNLLPYKYDSSEDLGYNKQDVGCDLMDFDKNIYAQCKYYISSNLREDQIASFINFVDGVCEDDAKFMLIVNEELRLFKPLQELLEGYGIEPVVESRESFMKWLTDFMNETALWEEFTDSISNSSDELSSDSSEQPAKYVGKIDGDMFMNTAREWIKEHPSTLLQNGLYKEPPARIQFMGFDFGRYYHTYGKTGHFGESIKEELATMFFYPPDFKRVSDEDRIALLSSFWESNQRLPQLSDIVSLPESDPLSRTVNGLSYRRLYELCTRPGNPLRDAVTEIFKSSKKITTRSSSLTNNEILSLFTAFKEKYNRIPRGDDNFQNVNIYRLWLAIKKGEHGDIRPKVLSLFE